MQARNYGNAANDKTGYHMAVQFCIPAVFFPRVNGKSRGKPAAKHDQREKGDSGTLFVELFSLSHKYVAAMLAHSDSPTMLKNVTSICMCTQEKIFLKWQRM